MNRMRQEAIRRSQEMYKRSSVTSSHYSQGDRRKGDVPPAEKACAEVSESKKNESQDIRANHRNDSQLSEFIDNLFQGKLDSDKLMILMLMIILIREGADLKLILALGYILL